MIDEDDPTIKIIKARKMRELMAAHAAAQEKAKKTAETASNKNEDFNNSDDDYKNRQILLSYLYDRGDEVLSLAESQFPVQTKLITKKIVELIKLGEIDKKISGGELRSLFRSVGLNVKVNTTIKIEDHGKLLSFSEKLKQRSNDEEE